MNLQTIVVAFLCVATSVAFGANAKSEKQITDRGPATAGGARCEITGAGLEVAKVLEKCEAGSSHSVTILTSQHDSRESYARTLLVCCLKEK